MIKIENINTCNWEAAIRSMRNPLNSWDKSDSEFEYQRYNSETEDFDCFPCVKIGENDLSLMKKLVRAGSDHRKFLRQIMVSMDITAPLYWWKEFDTYKVATVANSTSTMHKIHAKPFSRADFSTDHMDEETLAQFDHVIAYLELLRGKYMENKDKRYWYDMIQFLPSSYNQMRTCTFNYENLRNMYASRKHHKLDEWHDYCDWLEGLPYFKEICLGEGHK